MLNRFFLLFRQMMNALSATAVTFALSGAALLGFFLALVLTIVRPRDEKGNFLLFAIALALFEGVFSLWHAAFDGVVSAFTFPVLTVAVSCLLQLVLEATRKARLSARTKRAYNKVEKAIDRELDSEKNLPKEEPRPIRPPVRYIDEDFPLQRMEESARGNVPNKEKICLEHAASVIEKLSYYDLTPSDLKQVDELEQVIRQAEREGVTSANRERINDGLSELLKIMSKYAV